MTTPLNAGGANNIYQRGGNLGDEWERLRSLTFPTGGSMRALGDVAGLSVLDVGAGASTLLGDEVVAAGGSYTAMDVSPEAVAAQQAHGHTAITGTVTELPFAEGDFDVVHARFVLPHLARTEQRIAAIGEMLRVTRNRVLILEHILQSASGTPAVDMWRHAVEQMDQYPGLPVKPLLELVVEDEAKQVTGDSGTLEVRRLDRAPGNYYQEIISATEAVMLRVAKGVPELEALWTEVGAALKAEAAAKNPRPFNMPNLLVVTIIKA